MKSVIMVVAAIVMDDLERPTEVLAARRRSPPALAGRWEFPGGKVEPGEDVGDAVRREAREELGIGLTLGAELTNPAGGAWPISATLELRLWFAAVADGVVEATGSHDELRWLRGDQLFDVDWLDPDVAVVRALSAALDLPGASGG